MKYILVLTILVLAGGFARAQDIKMSDYITLKKPNGRHVAVYFVGTKINFIRAGGQEIEGIVEAVRNDSVFVRQWNIQTYMTQFGTTRVDTFGYFIHKMDYREIYRINTDKKESWRFVKNGSIFMIGGAGYALLNVINGAYLDQPLSDPRNLTSLGIALGVAGGGFILNRIYRKKERTGKKYVIGYVHMNDSQK